jgi:hypothetical protein
MNKQERRRQKQIPFGDGKQEAKSNTETSPIGKDKLRKQEQLQMRRERADSL